MVRDGDSYCSECGLEVELLYEEEKKEYNTKKEKLWEAETKYARAKTKKSQERRDRIADNLSGELEEMHEIT